MDGVIFGKAAEVIAQHCKKGKLFAMGGKLQPEKWEDQQGNKRSKVKLFIEGFKILEWATNNQDNNQQPQQPQQQSNYQAPVQQQPQQNNQQNYQQPVNNNVFQPIDIDDDIKF